MLSQSSLVKSLFFSFIFSIIMASCGLGAGGEGDVGAEANVELPGTSWVLIGYGPEDNLTAVLPDTVITIQFETDRISGSSGCNSYFADGLAADGKLTLGPIGSTLMACSEEIMQQEAEFSAALGEVSQYKISGNQLTLVYEGGVLVFEAEAPAETG